MSAKVLTADQLAVAAAIHQAWCAVGALKDATWSDAHYAADQKAMRRFLDHLHAAGKEVVDAGKPGSLMPDDFLATP